MQWTRAYVSNPEKTMPEKIIEIQNVHKWFGRTHALDDVSIDVEPGEVLVIIGPSGSGKSTLLRSINHLETVNSGEIVVDGIHLTHKATDINAVRAEVGMVFQQFNLFPHLTVLENVSKAPIVVKNIRRDEAEAEAAVLLDKVGLGQHLHHRPAQLSGGQQQRAAIARALAMSPRIMLYDEPTSALDPSLVDEVLQVMQQLNQEGMTQIVVTHKMSFAREAADQMVYFEEGRIIEHDTPETMFSQPKDERTRKFLKRYLSTPTP